MRRWMTWDILIRGGTLYDGSGRPGESAELAIADGRIVRIGAGLSGAAERVIDAGGLAVTPGFIDIKTHSDFTLPINPKAESKVRQGVTTEIIGHCGFSVVPVLPGKTQLLADYLSGGAPWLPFRELGFSEYLDTFPAVAVNAGIADIAIFDPNDFRYEATYANSHRYPSGERTTVIVNGTVVVENARHPGATPGTVLRRAPNGSAGQCYRRRR